MNYVTLRQVMDDFMLSVDVDDYISSVNDAQLRNIALRGIREFGFDISKRIKSLKSNIESNNTVKLPSDYVDLLKVGIVGGDGVVYVLNQNKNLNYSRKLAGKTTPVDDKDGPMYLEQNEVENRLDDKTATSGGDTISNGDPFESYGLRI